MTTAPELYLIIEIDGRDATAASARLTAAMAAAEVASVLLRPSPSKALDAAVAKTLTALAQKRGIAVLIDSDASLARMIKADGVHLPWSKDPLKAYREAREILGSHAMIGADAGRSRDDAMELGEQGADYIAFGIPAHVEDRATAEARQRDLVAWWSEIFEVPCVAFDIASPEQASALAASSAEFITVAVPATMSPDAAAGHVASFAAATTTIAEAAV